MDVLVTRLMGRRYLREVIPNLEDLMDRPEEVLRTEIRIGPLSFWRMIGALAGAALLLYLLDLWVPLHPWYLYTFYAIIGTLIFAGLIRAAIGRRHEIYLRRDGVEFRFGEQSVWCPWSLFDSSGPGATSTYGDSVDLYAYVPVARQAIPFVEYRVDGHCLSTGLQVKTPQFAFRSDEQAWLTPQYEVYNKELVGLLVQLGRTLGDASSLPPVPQPPLATLDRKGWITVPFAHLVLPTRCTNCGGDFDEYVEFQCRTWMLFFVHRLRLSIPLCDPCHAKLSKLKWIWAVVGTLTGSLAALLAWLIFGPRVFGGGLLVLAGLSACGGWLLGWALFHRYGLPVRADFIGFLEQTHVILKFRLPGIAKEFIEERNGGAEPP